MSLCDNHNFTVIHSDQHTQAEVCKDCGFKKQYKKIDNRINNQEYLKDHIRDFAQPTGPTAKIFERYYGKPKE